MLRAESASTGIAPEIEWPYWFTASEMAALLSILGAGRGFDLISDIFVFLPPGIPVGFSIMGSIFLIGYRVVFKP
ncbi:MAG: hypothetical protein EB156_05575 [Euryarchaeota archaeon]|nr:hypothetical protein [Euryarchaeota archaeon]